MPAVPGRWRHHRGAPLLPFAATADARSRRLGAADVAHRNPATARLEQHEQDREGTDDERPGFWLGHRSCSSLGSRPGRQPRVSPPDRSTSQAIGAT